MGIIQMLMSAVAAALDPLILKRSTRFDDDDSAYLNRTPSSAGNRKTWTFSCWVKRAEFDNTWPALFTAGPSGTTSRTVIRFDYNVNGGEFTIFAGTMNLYTDGAFKDPSAWYHLVVAVDTTDQTAADRVKVYVNGTQRALSGTNAALDEETYINSNELHILGSDIYNTAWGCSAYLADVNFLDGIAADATSFGLTDATTGQWVPGEYTGSYGTNGFHLVMDPAEAGINYTDATTFGATIYWPDKLFNGDTSNDGRTQLTGTGSGSITLTNLGTGTFQVLASAAGSSTIVFNSDSGVGTSGVEWLTVSGNTLTNITLNQSGYDTCQIQGIKKDGVLLVDHTAIGHDSSGQNNDWHENNLVDTLGSANWSSNLAASNGFKSGIPATQAFDGDTGTRAGNNKSTGGGTLTYTGIIHAGSSIEFLTGGQNTVTINGSINAGTASSDPEWVSYNSAVTVTSFVVTAINTSGYRADLYAVKVDGVVLIDPGPAELDLLADTPGVPYDNSLYGGGNYATLNPLDSATTLTNGNLTITGSGSAFKGVRSTIGMKTGKWYFEGKQVALASATSSGFGIWDDTVSTGNLNSGGGSYGNNYLAIMDYSGNIIYVLGGSTTIIEAGSISAGDIFGFALDLDNGTLKVHQNGTYLNSGNSIYSTWPSDRTYFFGGYEYNSGNTLEFNFGARAFAYTLPQDAQGNDFKALNTYNLNTTTILSGTYEGNGDADGPAVWMNATPTTLKISSTNNPPQPGDSVTFDPAVVDPLASGFKIRHASTNNVDGTTYYWLATATRAFKHANAQ